MTQNREIEGEDVLDIKDLGSPVLIVPENGMLSWPRVLGTSVSLKQSEIGLMMASANRVVINAEELNDYRLM